MPRDILDSVMSVKKWENLLGRMKFTFNLEFLLSHLRNKARASLVSIYPPSRQKKSTSMYALVT